MIKIKKKKEKERKLKIIEKFTQLRLYSYYRGFDEGYLFFPVIDISSFLSITCPICFPKLFILRLSAAILADWGLPYEIIGFFIYYFLVGIFDVRPPYFNGNLESYGDL